MTTTRTENRIPSLSTVCLLQEILVSWKLLEVMMAKTRDFYSRYKDVPGSDVILLMAAGNLRADVTPRGNESKMQLFDRLSKESEMRSQRSAPIVKKSLPMQVSQEGGNCANSVKQDTLRTTDTKNKCKESEQENEVSSSSSPPYKKLKEIESDDILSDMEYSFVETNISMSTDDGGD